jgi:hypothetical protein
MALPLISEQYTSASATVHTINHKIDTSSPTVIVIDQATGEYVIPSSIAILSTSQVQITLFSALAIRGSIS